MVVVAVAIAVAVVVVGDDSGVDVVATVVIVVITLAHRENRVRGYDSRSSNKSGVGEYPRKNYSSARILHTTAEENRALQNNEKNVRSAYVL